jgi:hypothetical protein
MAVSAQIARHQPQYHALAQRAQGTPQRGFIGGRPFCQQRAHFCPGERTIASGVRKLRLCVEQPPREAAKTACGRQRGVGARGGSCVSRFHEGIRVK